jgi:hypothetical protein
MDIVGLALLPSFYLKLAVSIDAPERPHKLLPEHVKKQGNCLDRLKSPVALFVF